MIVVNTVVGLHGMGVGSSLIENGVKWALGTSVLNPLSNELGSWVGSQIGNPFASDNPEPAPT